MLNKKWQINVIPFLLNFHVYQPRTFQRQFPLFPQIWELFPDILQVASVWLKGHFLHSWDSKSVCEVDINSEVCLNSQLENQNVLSSEFKDTTCLWMCISASPLRWSSFIADLKKVLSLLRSLSDFPLLQYANSITSSSQSVCHFYNTESDVNKLRFFFSLQGWKNFRKLFFSRLQKKNDRWAETL